jgi:hypothetical protein
MATYTLEIPDEVVTLIKEEFKIEPITYLQNEITAPLMRKYAEAFREKDAKEVEARIEKEVAQAKKQIKLKSSTEK